MAMILLELSLLDPDLLDLGAPPNANELTSNLLPPLEAGLAAVVDDKVDARL